jgi:hypothetical protein
VLKQVANPLTIYPQSVFGMNINGVPGDVSQYWTNTTTFNIANSSSLHPLTTPDTNNTVSTQVSTDNADTRSWSFSLFWAIAVPVAFGSTAVPWFGGSVYRWCAGIWQRAGRGKRLNIMFALAVFYMAVYL